MFVYNYAALGWQLVPQQNTHKVLESAGTLALFACTIYKLLLNFD